LGIPIQQFNHIDATSFGQLCHSAQRQQVTSEAFHAIITAHDYTPTPA
jgi:hypothetical protein